MNNLTTRNVVKMYAEAGLKISQNEASKLIKKIKAGHDHVIKQKKKISDSEFYALTDTI